MSFLSQPYAFHISAPTCLWKLLFQNGSPSEVDGIIALPKFWFCCKILAPFKTSMRKMTECNLSSPSICVFVHGDRASSWWNHLADQLRRGNLQSPAHLAVVKSRHFAPGDRSVLGRSYSTVIRSGHCAQRIDVAWRHSKIIFWVAVIKIVFRALPFVSKSFFELCHRYFVS